MITTDTTTANALTAEIKGEVYLIEMAFKSVTARFNTSSEDLVVGGNTYFGRGQLIDFPGLVETEDAGNSKLTIGFALLSPELKAATIGDATEFRRRPIRVYLQLMDDTFQPVGQAKLRWKGYMDKVSVEKSQSDSGFSGKIKLESIRPGLSRIRRYEGLRVTHQQHIVAFPNDRGLEYMQGLVNAPAPWLSVEFQKQ